MYESTNSVLDAARALARNLALPLSKATVFAWSDDTGERIVVAVDHRLLREATSIPSYFEGYRVEVQDEVGAVVTIPRN